MKTKEIHLREEDLNILIRLIKELKYSEALGRFYHDSIITHENENPPTIGLSNYLKMSDDFVNAVSHYSCQLINKIIIGEITALEWIYQFEHKEWGSWNRKQLSVQRWKNQKIIHERHYWNEDQLN